MPPQRQLAQPVPHHAGLSERERHEHADDVELDEHGEVRLEHHEDHGCREREDHDAVRVDQAVAAGRERLRRVAVAGEHRAEQREAVERGVGREQQHERRRRLDHVEEDRAVAERGRRDLGDEAALRLGGAVRPADEVARVLGVVHLRDEGDAVRPANRTIAMPPISTRVRCALRTLGRRNAGTPFEMASTPVRAEHPLAKERSSSRMMPAWVSDSALDAVRRRLGDRRVAEHRAREADDDHDEDAADEQVGRHRERLRRLAHAAQVHRGEDDDEEHRELDAERVELGDRRDDVVDARRDRHDDGHHVVDEQGGGHDEAGLLAEVAVRHLVVAAARRVGADQLAVGRDDRDEQHDDRDRDPRREAQEGEPADHEDHEQLLRRVRHGGERVAREDREREVLREELPLEVLGGQRVADDPVLRRLQFCRRLADFIRHGG